MRSPALFLPVCGYLFTALLAVSFVLIVLLVENSWRYYRLVKGAEADYSYKHFQRTLMARGAGWRDSGSVR